MPRNSVGTYTLPLPEVVSGEVIESVWANTTLEDIGDALTNSLSRNGEGGMLAPFRFADGTEAAPGAAWENAPGTGFFRTGTELAAAWNASQIWSYNALGITMAPGKEIFISTAPSSGNSAVTVDGVLLALSDYLELGGGTLTGGLFVHNATLINTERFGVKSDPLDVNINDQMWNSVFTMPDANETKIVIKAVRWIAGANHDSTMSVIQRRVDATNQGFLGFATGGSVPIAWSLGYGTTVHLYSGTNGNMIAQAATSGASFTAVSSVFAPTSNVSSALQLSGSFGGGLTFYDTNYVSVWVQSAGALYSIGFGGGGGVTARWSVDSSGNTYQTAISSATGFYVTSLRAMKRNITDVQAGALERLMHMHIYEYTYKNDKFDHPVIGTMADECSRRYSDGTTVSTNNVLFDTVQALKELNHKVDRLAHLVVTGD